MRLGERGRFLGGVRVAPSPGSILHTSFSPSKRSQVTRCPCDPIAVTHRQGLPGHPPRGHSSLPPFHRKWESVCGVGRWGPWLARPGPVLHNRASTRAVSKRTRRALSTPQPMRTSQQWGNCTEGCPLIFSRGELHSDP